MPMPKQMGPAQPRRDAGVPERKQNTESQHNKPEAKGAPGRRIKGEPGDTERTPGTGALPAKQAGNDVDPGTG
jgi:hypothetical protein